MIGEAYAVLSDPTKVARHFSYNALFMSQINKFLCSTLLVEKDKLLFIATIFLIELSKNFSC